MLFTRLFANIGATFRRSLALIARAGDAGANTGV